MSRLIRALALPLLSVGIVGGAAFGLAGPANATPLNDPNGLCSFHDDKGNCWVAASGPSVNIDMAFPANDPQEQAMVDYLTKVENDFNADTQLGTLDDAKPMQELDVTTTSYSSGGTQSTVLKVYQNEGGAHPALWYQGYNFNNATKTPITFDTLFRPGTQPLGVLLPIVEQAMTHEAGQPITVDPADGLDPANYQSFAITNDAVIFFFGQNQLHPAFGPIEVSVPRTAIADQLSPGI
jgi:hypothetical protein